ncbi:PIN domain-containing protein [Desulfosarcina sp. OttesenSCG-928-G10]|nr:PIN domain-containing protein [Desulfosarcina sp. OttesenSCG-928-G10]
MKIYLDNCCFNRPFDDQTSLVIQMETESKLYVQEMIRKGVLELVWSFVLDYENRANPFAEVRNRIAEWKKLARTDCGLSDKIANKAGELMKLGLRQMDASHVACALHLGAECFLTTDKKILNKPITGIEVINPIDFVRRYSNAQ